MNTLETIFRMKKPISEKLFSFGFTNNRGLYSYSADIAGGLFYMTVTVTIDGAVEAKVIDRSSGEEYVLHRTAGASGAFIGLVRDDYENTLRQIAENCFEPDVFKSTIAKEVIKYLWDTYQDKPEFLWERFSDNAIFRRKDIGKWYAVLLILSKRKLGIESDEIIDILDLRMKTEDINSVVDMKKYFPGYHMNKKHWVTICLDGSVSIDEIVKRINESYNLTVK